MYFLHSPTNQSEAADGPLKTHRIPPAPSSARWVRTTIAETATETLVDSTEAGARTLATGLLSGSIVTTLAFPAMAPLDSAVSPFTIVGFAMWLTITEKRFCLAKKTIHFIIGNKKYLMHRIMTHTLKCSNYSFLTSLTRFHSFRRFR